MAQYIKHRQKYRPGDYKVRSDESGLTVMNSECRVTWRGHKVRANEFDIKHPQLTLHPRNDKIAVRDPRPTSENDDDLPWGEGNKNDL